jgi:hypothetical protein
MATGVKSVNLPLVLPWVVAIWPAIPVVSRRPAASIAVLVIAAFASCFPTALLNFRQTGHWTGDPRDEHRVKQPNTFVGFVSNAVMLAVANTQPPVLPNPSLWNQRFESWLARTPLEAECRSAPRFETRWGELPTEELAGAGPGLLLISGLLSAMALKYRKRPRRPHRSVVWGLGLAGWIAFACFVAQFSSEAIGRLSAPFVPILLLPLLQLPSVSNAFRPGWMRVLAVTCSALSLPGLVFSPARPLFPVNALISATGSGRFGRIAAVYATYGQRSDCYAPLLEKLHAAPDGELWFAGGGDDPEAPAWKPYGNWKVKQWTEVALSPPVVLASELGVRERFGLSWEEFLEESKADVFERAELCIRAGRGAEKWYLLRVPSRSQ